MKKIKYILASKSPRRQELFKIISDDFECVVSNIEETYPDDLPLEEVPRYLARKKAESVAENYKDFIVIGSDTGVFINGEMYGKPKNELEAFETLKLLSGNTHKVITGCAIYKDHLITDFSVEALVKFRELTDTEIIEYINTKEPMDKAGSYGIQGKGALLVEEIHGDYYTIMGLPISRLAVELNNIK